MSIKKGVLPATTAVAELLGLWYMEPRVADSNPGRHIELFFFLSRKFSKFFGGLVVLYVTVL